MSGALLWCLIGSAVIGGAVVFVVVAVILAVRDEEDD